METRIKLCPECAKQYNEYVKAWKNSHKDKVKEYNRKYQANLKAKKLSTAQLDKENIPAIIGE